MDLVKTGQCDIRVTLLLIFLYNAKFKMLIVLQTVFGSQGSGSFMMRLTAGFAALFFITSLSLGYLASQHAHKQSTVSPLVQQTIPVQAPAKTITVQPKKVENALPPKQAATQTTSSKTKGGAAN